MAARNAAGELAMRSNSAGDSSRKRSRNRAAVGRSGDEASRSSMRSAASMLSGHLGQDLDGIAGPHGPGREHAGIKAAHSPAGGRRVESFDLGIVDLLPDSGAVDLELETRDARRGDLEHRSPGADLI